jgi:myo-inositol-1(or 4)-monophosphatase
MNNLLEPVINIAKTAGDFIRQERSHFSKDRIEKKGLNDMVSYVDKTSEQMIVAELKKLIPDPGFIVEENSAEGKKEYNWIVDPLDGTTNFIHGVPCYAVSIALEHKGEIILGVVYEVSRDECFYASKGNGAFLNGKSIHVSDNKTLSDSLIATGFPIYNFTKLDNYLNTLKYFMQHTHGVRRIGAAAADLCYLACGRFDAFFEYNLSPWDVAAGAIIIKEAGGRVTDFKGGNTWLYGKEICGTNGLFEKEFLSAIQSHF